MLSSWRGHCESSSGLFDECRLSAGCPPTLKSSQPTWPVSPPVGCYRPHPPSPFIISGVWSISEYCGCFCWEKQRRDVFWWQCVVSWSWDWVNKPVLMFYKLNRHSFVELLPVWLCTHKEAVERIKVFRGQMTFMMPSQPTVSTISREVIIAKLLRGQMTFLILGWVSLTWFCSFFIHWLTSVPVLLSHLDPSTCYWDI